MIKKILFLAFVCFASSLDEYIKIENFHPPNGFQPVRGYEPPNYNPSIQQAQIFNNQLNYYGQNYENYEPRNQYENNQLNQYQQSFQTQNHYQNNYQQNNQNQNQYNYNNNNNNQNYPANNWPTNNYQTNGNGNNWQANNQNYNQYNQFVQPVNNQNNNVGDGWRRTAPPTKFTTTTKWTGWTDTTTKYNPPMPPAPAAFHPVTAPPILVTPPPYYTQQPQTTTGTTTVNWKQVFLNSASTAKSNYIEAVQNVHNNNGVFGVDDQCLKCLCFIESWCSDVGCVLDQGSLSCGWYQLKYEYWLDCGQPGGGWKECSNSKSCAEGCVRAYMSRYSSFCGLGSACPHLGRIHNGGPHGCSNNNTEYYGWLIERCLKRQAPYEKIDTFKIPN